MGLLDDKTYMVSVLRQKMLGIAPVFMYRIKKEMPVDQDYKYVQKLDAKFSSFYIRLLFTLLLVIAKPVPMNGTSVNLYSSARFVSSGAVTSSL